MTIPPEALHPASLVHRNGHIRAGSPRPGIRAGSPRPGIRAGSPRPGIPRQPRSCPPELADPMRWSGSWASYSGSVGCGWEESGSQAPGSGSWSRAPGSDHSVVVLEAIGVKSLRLGPSIVVDGVNDTSPIHQPRLDPEEPIFSCRWSPVARLRPWLRIAWRRGR